MFNPPLFDTNYILSRELGQIIYTKNQIMNLAVYRKCCSQ
nr:MAG TPA: hypothetical protein [Caudoviricetes sp.]